MPFIELCRLETLQQQFLVSVDAVVEPPLSYKADLPTSLYRIVPIKLFTMKCTDRATSRFGLKTSTAPGHTNFYFSFEKVSLTTPSDGLE